jgi:hypothetical protein
MREPVRKDAIFEKAGADPVMATDAHDSRAYCHRCGGTVSMNCHATAAEMYYCTAHHEFDARSRVEGRQPGPLELSKEKKLDCIALHMIDTGASKNAIANSYYLRVAVGMGEGEWLPPRKIQARLEHYTTVCEERLRRMSQDCRSMQVYVDTTTDRPGQRRLVVGAKSRRWISGSSAGGWDLRVAR